MTADTDEDRWAEAQSLLDGVPTESADRRLPRARRLTLLIVAAVVVVSAALALVALAWFGDGLPDGGSDDGPLWRQVAGLVVSGLAVVVLAVVLVVQWRGNRRRRAWRSPLLVLSRRQRKDLLAQVRGRAEVVPERLPLARHLAETLVDQRIAVALYLGLLLLYSGQLLTLQTSWWTVLGVGYAVAGAVFLPNVVRNARRAQTFLDAHPAEPAAVPSDER